MKHFAMLAMLFIAIYSESTRASSQNVYRCGSNYSQEPCVDGVEVKVQDARSPAQRAESEAAAHRQASTANAMEKARLKEEAQLRATSAKTQARSKDKKNSAAKPNKVHTKKKEPEYFTARGTSAKKPKAAASRSQ